LFESTLLLAHVVRSVAPPIWLGADVSVDERRRGVEAQERLTVLAHTVGRIVPAKGRVLTGRVADEISKLAVAEGAGLVITALRDRRGWFGAKRGSMSHEILSQAVTPVLAWPPQWRPR